MKVTIGDACTLECKVAGTPQLSTGWFKDGKELTSSQKYRITFLNNVSTLKIMDTEKEDGGLYTFAVQNDVGKSSCTASVDVLGLLGTLSSTFYKNFFLAILCPLFHFFTHFLSNHGFIIFSYADRIIPPSFTRKLKEIPCVLGSSALLECKVSGSPPISVAWFQNGIKLVSGEKHQMSFSDNLCILEVNSLSHSDTGTYTCKATNTAGSDECSTVLTVQGGYMMVRKLSELLFSLSLLKLSAVFC